MKRKFILVYFLIFFVGISLFSYDLKKDFVDTYKKILIDQREFFAISKKLMDKHFEDVLYIDEEVERIKNSLTLYISLLDLYSRIKPECKESKQSGKEYLKKRFHLEAESKKFISGNLLKHHSNFQILELIPYLKKCIEYNTKISLLLKEFR